MSDLFASVRWRDVADLLLGLVRNPASNLTASLLLLSAVVVFFLLIVLAVIAMATRPSRSQADEDEEMRLLIAILAPEESVDEPALAPASIAPVRERRSLGSWITPLLVALAVMVVVAVAVGGTSAQTAVCLSCHETTAHSEVAAAGGVDPHASTACVRCHEGAGWSGRLTIEVPGRFAHFANGLRAEPRATGYGGVVSSACLRCHRSVALETTEDAERGIRMSHEEPLAARARCTDCHTLSTGVISTVTSGMAPCLRCHDGVDQPTTCTLCHTKDVSAATRSRQNPAKMVGRDLVPTPDCGGCHDEAQSCDPCHGGQRMPHSELFMWWGHAREGVKDVWDNGGERCGTCHTAQRRPCTKCHAFFPGHPAAVFSKSHGQVAPKSCDSCHGRKAYVKDRDFCAMCHQQPYITQ